MAISTNSNGTFKEDASPSRNNLGSLSATQRLFSPTLPDVTPEELEDLKQRALMELKADKSVITSQGVVCNPIQINRQVSRLHDVLEKRKTEMLRTSDGSVLRTAADVDALVGEIRGHRARTGTMGEDATILSMLADRAKDQCGKAPAAPSIRRQITQEDKEVFMAFMSLKDKNRPPHTAKTRQGNKKVREPTQADIDEQHQAAKVAIALGMPGESKEKVRAEVRARIRRGEFLVSPRPEIELDDAAKEVLRRELELRAMKQKLSFDMRIKVDEVLARMPSRPPTPAATQEASTPER